MSNMDFWQGQAGKWYVESCEYLQYPQIPLAEYLDAALRPQDSVLDIGCGFGFSSMYMASRCAAVYALDPSRIATDWLRERCASRGIDNVVPVCGRFPEAEVPECDVSVTLYLSRELYDKHSAEQLLRFTRREGLILVSHSYPENSLPKLAYDHLGLPLYLEHYHNGCYLVGMFEAMGIECDCRMIEHDFGQPLHDMDEAVAFLRHMLRAGDELLPRLRVMAEQVTQKRGDVLYVPNMRRSCLVHFKK